MKAFYITEPGSTTIGELQQPRPSAAEVLLKTRLIGMCGTDLSTFRGKNPLVSYPRIPGHEIAATIVEVGSSVPAEYQPGTNVTVYPTHTAASAHPVGGDAPTPVNLTRLWACSAMAR